MASSVICRWPSRNHKATLIPLLDTTLLTNAPGEPRVGSQVLEEIPSADRIDIVMAFIRQSGISLSLSRFVNIARRPNDQGSDHDLHRSTEVAPGSTERYWCRCPISYDLTGTRLHAKAWLFHRQSGFSTAYIGSRTSPLRTGQRPGVERSVSGAPTPDVVDKLRLVFDSYWHNPDSRPTTGEFKTRAENARSDGRPSY